uniref:Uncharacterized protein n=1 Tax=Rhizophora mucronata TaxID=61149 RepID=A0A2P2PL37_RHIMU
MSSKRKAFSWTSQEGCSSHYMALDQKELIMLDTITHRHSNN